MSDIEIPDIFIDCISQELIEDPVLAEDNHTYSRSTIEEWFNRNIGERCYSPKTGELIGKSLKPNFAFKQTYDHWRYEILPKLRELQTLQENERISIANQLVFKQFCELDLDEVHHFLCNLGLNNFADIFHRNQMDGLILAECKCDDDLKVWGFNFAYDTAEVFQKIEIYRTSGVPKHMFESVKVLAPIASTPVMKTKPESEYNTLLNETAACKLQVQEILKLVPNDKIDEFKASVLKKNLDDAVVNEGEEEQPVNIEDIGNLIYIGERVRVK